MEETQCSLNDPIHGNDSWDQLEMGIKGQNHRSDSLPIWLWQSAVVFFAL